MRHGVLRGLLLLHFAGLVLLGVACSGSKENRVSSVSETRYIVGQDTSFDVEGGEIAIQDIRFEYGAAGKMASRPTEVELRLLNNTDRYWESIDFRVRLKEVGNEDNSDAQSVSVDLPRPSNIFAPGKPFAVEESKIFFVDMADSLQYATEVESFNADYHITYRFKMASPVVKEDLVYESDSLRYAFDVSDEGIAMRMENKAKERARIDWNEASFVDFWGSSHRVIHSGISFSERGRSHPPTVVPPGASAEEVVFPESYLTYDGGWEKQDIIPKEIHTDDMIGRSVGLFLPVEVGDEVRRMSFEFTVAGTRPVTESGR